MHRTQSAFALRFSPKTLILLATPPALPYPHSIGVIAMLQSPSLPNNCEFLLHVVEKGIFHNTRVSLVYGIERSRTIKMLVRPMLSGWRSREF